LGSPSLDPALPRDRLRGAGGVDSEIFDVSGFTPYNVFKFDVGRSMFDVGCSFF
jgi:hypothetical protein